MWRIGALRCRVEQEGVGSPVHSDHARLEPVRDAGGDVERTAAQRATFEPLELEHHPTARPEVVGDATEILDAGRAHGDGK